MRCDDQDRIPITEQGTSSVIKQVRRPEIDRLFSRWLALVFNLCKPLSRINANDLQTYPLQQPSTGGKQSTTALRCVGDRALARECATTTVRMLHHRTHIDESTVSYCSSSSNLNSIPNEVCVEPLRVPSLAAPSISVPLHTTSTIILACGDPLLPLHTCRRAHEQAMQQRTRRQRQYSQDTSAITAAKQSELQTAPPG